MPAPSAPSLYWPDEFTLSTFQLLLDALTGTTELALAGVSVVRDGWLHPVGTVPDQECTSWPLAADVPVVDVEKLHAWGESWGTFIHVPHERIERGRQELVSVVDGSGPLDLLFAPFSGPDGELVGVLWVKLPESDLAQADCARAGRLPSSEERRALDRFAGIIGKAVRASARRGAIIRRLELAEAARAMVRAASTDLASVSVFDRIKDGLLTAFALEHASARILAGPETAETLWVANGPTSRAPATARLEEAVATAGALWRRARMGVAYGDGRLLEIPDTEDARALTGLVTAHGLSSIALVPLGHGEECLGVLCLARGIDGPEWDETELAVATEIGRDLGQVIRLRRAFAREQTTVRRLRELDSSRSRFVAMVSHELKNPLTAALANLELLEDVAAGDPTGERAVDGVTRAAERMLDLVEDLLLLSRAADPERALRADVVDLAEVVRDVCHLSEVTAAGREITMHVRISSDRPTNVLGDARQLDRVVLNLVSNALKYTPEGRAITIVVRRVVDEVELCVCDEGIGISASDQRHILEEFFRSGDPQVRAQSGTGLGLAIADQLVRRHGGRLEVSSELGRGSTFRVLLPAADPTPGS